MANKEYKIGGKIPTFAHILTAERRKPETKREKSTRGKIDIKTYPINFDDLLTLTRMTSKLVVRRKC